jgi:hypothetical protein
VFHTRFSLHLLLPDPRLVSGVILDDLIMENLVGTEDFRLLLDLLLH